MGWPMGWWLSVSVSRLRHDQQQRVRKVPHVLRCLMSLSFDHDIHWNINFTRFTLWSSYPLFSSIDGNPLVIKHGLLENHGWFSGWFPRHVMKPLRFDNDGPHLVMAIPQYIHCFLLLRHNHLWWFAITCIYIYIYMCVFLWFFEPLLVYITRAAILTNIHIYIYTYTTYIL